MTPAGKAFPPLSIQPQCTVGLPEYRDLWSDRVKIATNKKSRQITCMIVKLGLLGNATNNKLQINKGHTSMSGTIYIK